MEVRGDRTLDLLGTQPSRKTNPSTRGLKHPKLRSMNISIKSINHGELDGEWSPSCSKRLFSEWGRG